MIVATLGGRHGAAGARDGSEGRARDGDARIHALGPGLLLLSIGISDEIPGRCATRASGKESQATLNPLRTDRIFRCVLQPSLIFPARAGALLQRQVSRYLAVRVQTPEVVAGQPEELLQRENGKVRKYANGGGFG